jgi:hypothetical protein
MCVPLYIRNIFTGAVGNREFVANELMTVNDELQRIWKEVGVAYINVPFSANAAIMQSVLVSRLWAG